MMEYTTRTALGLALAALTAASVLPALARPLAAQQPPREDVRNARPHTDSADSAWARGDYVEAEIGYAARLAADSADARALHRMALILAWGERFDRSLAMFDRLLALRPDDPDAAVDRARVLAWQHEHRAAIDAVDRVLARHPDYLPALRARAQFQGWAGEHHASRDSYERILAQDPADLDALRGLARVTGWSGDHRGAERLWRRALEQEPGDVESLIGLSQVLRWQGRHVDARAAQKRAAAVAPDHPDLLAEMRWTRAALAPDLSPAVVLESDSDGNRIATYALVLAWHAAPRVELRADAYYRDLEQRQGPGEDRVTRGGQGTVIIRTAPGWTVSGSGGAGVTDDRTIGTYRVAVHTPPRTVQLRADYGRRLLDVTAQLAGNGVTVEELGLNAQVGSLRGWLLDTRASHAIFAGEDRNRRRFARAELGRPLGAHWRLSGVVTGFGFREQSLEGYFSPDYYGLGELSTRWSRELGSWLLHLEVAPGIQQVGSDGDVRGAFRSFGRVAYTVAPGRRIGIGLGYASNGLESFATRDADYRYRSLVVSGGWAF